MLLDDLIAGVTVTVTVMAKVNYEVKIILRSYYHLPHNVLRSLKGPLLSVKVERDFT